MIWHGVWDLFRDSAFVIASHLGQSTSKPASVKKGFWESKVIPNINPSRLFTFWVPKTRFGVHNNMPLPKQPCSQESKVGDAIDQFQSQN